MIHFKTVRYRNFLSTGDKFTEIKLDANPTTLVVGTNGAGKSTMLDALSFGLFGKAHRNINKDQLINSVNKKGTEVEVEFRISNTEFRVRRCIKPTKFEIYKNGTMVNQDSNARDYQKFLEQNILKLNHKSFHQIVVLGSSSFIPFMQLPAHLRRGVIEDLLDINIFSKMNALLKERNVKIRDELNDIGHLVELTNTKIVAAEKYIKDLKGINKDQIESKKASIVAHRENIEAYQEKNSVLNETLEEDFAEAKAKQEETQEVVRQLQTKDTNLKTKAKRLGKDAKFFVENDHCPTCDSDLTEEFKESHLARIREDAQSVSGKMDEIATALEELTTVESDNLATLQALQDKQNKINTNVKAITVIQTEIDKITAEIEKLTADSEEGDVSKAQDELNELKSTRESQVEKKFALNEERIYNDAIGEMLKDTGIKTKVIKQYLPVMNRFINQHLQVLDFFVAFHLDEAFNETIKSRHRDDFQYSSFSEGEKQRIDLALLFTWRQIAKMKNSAATNLLMLDETFDSSLDNDGIENLTKILSTLDKDTNVFIISHKGDVLENKFSNKIEFYKERNFSRMR